uniref:Sushi domain-containing protein n=1 Tax=Buteo japonicus TaxID=224669 RepID=A0A8B9ZBS6_9AVES
PLCPLPAAMGSGLHRSLLPTLLLVLLVLLPEAWGDCGPLPNITHAEPPEDEKHRGSFRVGSKVRYSCLGGYVKRPLLSDTIQCLANSQWSNLPEFCGRSCPGPPRVHFASISQEDGMQNFYPVGVSVKYYCRLGYENTTGQLPTSTCFDNLTWSEVPELCQSECLHPPTIDNGMHNGTKDTGFVRGSTVAYKCNDGYNLVGAALLQCMAGDQYQGVWSKPAPECRGNCLLCLSCWFLSVFKIPIFSFLCESSNQIILLKE